MAAIKGAKSVRALHATGARHTFSVNDIQTAVARRVSQSGELPRRGRPLTVTADTKVVIRDDHSKKKLMAFWPVVAKPPNRISRRSLRKTFRSLPLASTSTIQRAKHGRETRRTHDA